MTTIDDDDELFDLWVSIEADRMIRSEVPYWFPVSWSDSK